LQHLSPAHLGTDSQQPDLLELIKPRRAARVLAGMSGDNLGKHRDNDLIGVNRWA
jgi:hypothetical protein